MTKRVTVSLPDDVAEFLAAQPNASATVAEAVREQMDVGETIRRMMAAVGIHLTDEGRERARNAIPPFTEEQLARIRAKKAEVRARHRERWGSL